MLQAFAAAFRTPDLRRKLLFSLAIIAVYRLGAAVPGPGCPGGHKKTSPDRSGEALENGYSAWMLTALLRPRLSCCSS